MITRCACCGRQVVNYKVYRSRYVTSGPVTLLCSGEVACCECSRDLDEDGLFPEERIA